MPEPETPTTFRLFVAIAVPEQVKAGILKAQDQLRRAVPPEAARWTKLEQFHLTLRFLGNVDAAQVDPLVAALHTGCHGFGALRLRAAGIGFFPRPKSPRVIWAGLSDSDERLPALWGTVQSATSAFTAEEPDDHFTGHITLARIKSIRPKAAEGLAAAASELATAIFGEWSANEVELVRSQLSPQGARYSTVAPLPL